MIARGFALLLGLALLGADPARASCARCAGVPVEVDPNGAAGGPLLAGEADGTTQLLAAFGGSTCKTLEHVRSTDWGLSWSAPVRLDTDPGFPCTGPESHIAANGEGAVYAAWVAGPAVGPPALLVKTSRDRGATWPARASVVAALSARPGGHGARLLPGPGATAAVLWLDGPTAPEVHLWASRTDDFGATWSAPVQVDQGVLTPAADLVAARLAPETLHVLFADGENSSGYRFRYTRSPDGGATWSPSLLIDDLAARVFGGPATVLPLGAEGLLLGWSDDRAGGHDIYTRRSEDLGQTWTSPPLRVDTGDLPGAANSTGPLFARSGPGEEVAALWYERRDGYPRMYGNATLDGGRGWGLAAPVSAPVAASVIYQRALAATPATGWVTAAWRDSQRDTAPCNGNDCPTLYYSASCDAGVTWEADRRIDRPDGWINSPAMTAFPDGAASIAWNETAFGVDVVRIDGASMVLPRGPTTYCLGADPPLDARWASAACPGAPAWQWYLDGAPVPGATAPVYQPALPAGLHRVEARAACTSAPACSPGSVALSLDVRAPTTPPSIGNALRAVRGAAGAARLSWDAAPTAPDVHPHVRRAIAKAAPWSLISPDPAPPATRFEDPAPPAVAVVLYDLRQADVCESESVD